MRILQTSAAKHILLGSTPYVLLLLVMGKVGYLGWRETALIYLPIFVVAVLAMVWRQSFGGHLLLISAELGLLAEYGVHLMNGPKPNLSGAFCNTAILLAGTLAAVVVQLAINRRRR